MITINLTPHQRIRLIAALDTLPYQGVSNMIASIKITEALKVSDKEKAAIKYEVVGSGWVVDEEADAKIKPTAVTLDGAQARILANVIRNGLVVTKADEWAVDAMNKLDKGVANG